MINNKLKVLSLFSGIGAFEKGLINLGVDFELVNYCEIDKYPAKSYSLLYGVSEDLNLGDINQVDETNLSDFDLMTYGFPCQSFSVAGKKLGFDDPEKGNLFFESMRIARYKKPKYMIAENVKGLVGHDNGNTFKTILSTLEFLGYNNYYKVLNSVNFDIPQSRERIYIVSIRKDVDKGLFKFPEGTMTTKTVADFIDQDNENRYLKESLRPFVDTKYHREYTSNNGMKKVFDGNVQGFFTSDFGGKRLYSIYGVCPTLTTKKEMACFIEIGSELNSKERLRLQGFTDEDYFKLKGNIPEAQLKKQAGNSITVNVIQRIQECLLVSQGEIISNQIAL
jgi:DNA (cytosine-5)-methyltransferase 1